MKRPIMATLLVIALLTCGYATTSNAANAEAKKEVYFYNWTEYLPERLLHQFTKETGIKVIYATYESNEAMYAKMELLNSGGYDLVVPSTYFVNKMRAEGLLHEIDHSKLSNFKNLDPKLLNQVYDPDNKFSVPYMWGVTGIMVNSEAIDPAKVTSWNDLWNPEFKGQLLMLNDVRSVFHAALRVLGYSGNTTNPAEIEAAFKKLQLLMPNVRTFNSDKPSTPFLESEVNIGMIWNGEAYTAAKENPALKFVYPKEGAAIWIDNLVIPKPAKNVENAHKLINYLLRPEIAKAISEEIGYASPNLEAIKLLPKEVQNNKTAYPTAEALKNGEMQLDVGPTTKLYEEYWDKLKAQK